MSLRVVFDTNVRISAIIFKGRPLDATRHAVPPAFQQIISPALLDELRAVLSERFRWRESSISTEIAGILQVALQAVPDRMIDVCRDPDDNRVLECAIAGNADCIITGDKDLLDLVSYKEIRIQTFRQFLDAHAL